MMTEAIELMNYGAEEAVVPLSISFASNFRDMFEVRGLKCEQRGTVVPPRVEYGEVWLEYIGLDKVARRVRIEFSPAPDKLFADRADFTVALTAQAWISRYFTVAIEVAPLAGRAHARRD